MTGSETTERRRRGMGVGTAVIVLVLGLLGVAWTVPLLPPDEDVLTVTFSRGEARVEGADGSTTPVESGTVLAPGDRVVVERGGSVNLEALDGHAVTLDEESSLEVARARRTLVGGRVDTRLDVDRGGVTVSGDARPRTSLDIGLPNGVAGVRGTVLALEVGADQAAVAVHEGEAAISDAPGEPLELTAGQGAVVSAEGALRREVPRAPRVFMPESGSPIRAAGTEVTWTEVPQASEYRIEIAFDEGFREIAHRITSDTTAAVVPLLDLDEPLFLRVYGVTGEGLRGRASAPEPIEISVVWARALELQAEGSLAASVTEFERVRERFPEDARVLQNLGWSIYQMGQHVRAREVYEEGRALDPTNVTLLLELARVYFWLGDYAAAEEAYRAVMEINPSHDHAYWGLGDVRRMQGRRQEALDLVRRALSLNPEHPYARETLRLLRMGG